MSAIAGKSGLQDFDLVRDFWESQKLSANFATHWRHALHDGYLSGTEFTEVKNPEINRSISINSNFATLQDEDALELQLRPDPMIGDGRQANNGWLQETPRPISKLTWDNAAIISPKTAERLRLKSERLAELRLGNRSLRAPIWIMPGQAENVVTLHLGYGRKRSGRVTGNCPDSTHTS